MSLHPLRFTLYKLYSFVSSNSFSHTFWGRCLLQISGSFSSTDSNNFASSAVSWFRVIHT